MGTSLASIVKQLAKEVGLDIADEGLVEGRQARLVPVPERLHPSIQGILRTHYPRGLFSHQAAGMDAVLSGGDICLSTSTASGKSLVFLATAAHLLIDDPRARVLALYPAKALIQDQREKWIRFLETLDFRVGHIDGSVPMNQRVAILSTCRAVLMTPDVAHAWLMSHLGDKEVIAFLRSTKLLVLDEAHVYDGVFGTNMAYFLRRLQAVIGPHRLICSTATLGKPDDFLLNLTGKDTSTLGPEVDGSGIPSKSLILANVASSKSFETLVNLLRRIPSHLECRFLAFGDSRRMVEQVVAAIHRGSQEEEPEEEEESESNAKYRILPYRAGYEVEDRTEIQKALSAGRLAGVVSTSALELGLDIGEIDLVIMLTTPPSVKAFWQRLGRAGRRRPGVCLLIDDRGAISLRKDRLRDFLQRPIEPNWLYLDNKYIQYTNALCAAVEISEVGEGSYDLSYFTSLPPSFRDYLRNECHPTETIPSDLYPLKQRAQAGPHHQFPIRSGIEQNFQVKASHGQPLGSLTHSQAMREAYPGGIYHYLARPHRVYKFSFRTGEIHVRRERRYSTKPIAQAKVFPRFQGGILSLLRSNSAFVVEAEMQVSERVLGFIEQRGAARDEHRYGPASPWSQRELNRFFETTGVCWYFPDRELNTEAVAQRLLEAFAIEYAVQERDLGVGLFFAKGTPLGSETCQGACIFDATHGSLRLTQRLGFHFAGVAAAALSIAQRRNEAEVFKLLKNLGETVLTLRSCPVDQGPEPVNVQDVIDIVAPGSPAMCSSEGGWKEVEIQAVRYTPQGVMYDLKPPTPGIRWAVSHHTVRPIHGVSVLARFDPNTGEVVLVPEG